MLLLSIFTSSMAIVASNALLLSWLFLPLISPAFLHSSYNCWCCAIDIESYFSLEYFFNSIFPLKVLWVVLVFCFLEGLVWLIEATFTIGVGALVDAMSEKGHCVKVLLALVWMHPYCGNCFGQLVTPDAIQQVLNLQSWVKALVPTFHKVSQDNAT